MNKNASDHERDVQMGNIFNKLLKLLETCRKTWILKEENRRSKFHERT